MLPCLRLSPRRVRARLVVPFGLLVALAAILPAAPAEATSYSCGGNVQGHCYSEMRWDGGYVHGAQTSMEVRGFGLSNIFESTEMWLVDDTNGHNYWVEAGVMRDPSVDGGAEIWFWGDSRPVDNGYINMHYGIPLRSGDYGHLATIKIYNNGYDQYFVGIYGAQTEMTGESTNNTMTTPHLITIGSELAGSSGGSQPWVWWNDNMWLDTSNVWHYQGNDGTGTLGGVYSQYPFTWTWNPDPVHSSTGGSFNTCLPNPGC
jgi:hypothetical protein